MPFILRKFGDRSEISEIFKAFIDPTCEKLLMSPFPGGLLHKRDLSRVGKPPATSSKKLPFTNGDRVIFYVKKYRRREIPSC
jgi:hypothetical protein